MNPFLSFYDKKNLAKFIKRVISSVGSEHCLDRAGVTGSNPVSPTKS
tara:strand:- start:198 stop:338 length:141 start_codon:yes stop_codon:yes gene_type:complete